MREAVYQYLGFDGQGKPLSSPPVNPEVYAYNTDYYASWDYVLTDVDLLKEIEQMEQRSVFDKTGLVPQYSRKYTEFKSKLHKAELLLSSCISDQIRRGSADEDNPYYVGLREKLGLVKNLIKQSEQGDALSIQRPQRQS